MIEAHPPAMTHGIQIAATEDARLLGGRRSFWRRVDPTTLRQNLQDLLDQLELSLPPEAPSSDAEQMQPSGFHVKQIQVAVTIGAKGQVGILGTGSELTGQASLTLTLERHPA